MYFGVKSKSGERKLRECENGGTRERGVWKACHLSQVRMPQGGGCTNEEAGLERKQAVGEGRDQVSLR